MRTSANNKEFCVLCCTVCGGRDWCQSELPQVSQPGVGGFSFFFLYIRQSHVQPHVGSGIMAMPQSIMIRHAGLSKVLTNASSNFKHWYFRSSGHAYWPCVSL